MSMNPNLNDIRVALQEEYLKHWRQSNRKTLLIRADCGVGKTHQLAAAIAEIRRGDDDEQHPEDVYV